MRGKRRIETDKKYYQNNKEKILKRSKIWSEKNRDRFLNNQYLIKYGISLNTYKSMLAIQLNKCAICEKEETQKSGINGKILALSVDHCHETNKVRGLLCDRCNRGLGFFKDNIEIMNKAIDYLRKHR